MAQAKQQLDEATARATAIHDGAERRLNLLISRHTETVRRLTEIRDVVTSLVAGEAARGSLEDEVNRSLTAQTGANGETRQSSGPHDNPHGGAHRAGPRQVSAGGPGLSAGPTEVRRTAAAAAAAGPLDGHEPPVPRASSRREPTPLEREQPDPLVADRRESARQPSQSGDTVTLPADGQVDEPLHAPDRDRDRDSLPR